MKVGNIPGATRIFGPPIDWDKDTDSGECQSLPIRDVQTDNGDFMVSMWFPTPEELKALAEGKGVRLWIRGRVHPVVALDVEEQIQGS